MRLYSTHIPAAGTPGAPRRPIQVPILVKEGFSWPCLVLGWIGLLSCGSWIAGLLAGAASLALASLCYHGAAAGAWPVPVALHLLLALFANDLRRWELGLRGFISGPIVAGPTSGSALLRLLDSRPDLMGAGT